MAHRTVKKISLQLSAALCQQNKSKLSLINSLTRHPILAFDSFRPLIQRLSLWPSILDSNDYVPSVVGIDLAPPGGVSVLSDEASDPFDVHVLMAVPKSKISRSRKRRKHGQYEQKVKTNWYMCDKCGKPKLMHKLCDNYELCAQSSSN
ncbi:unnamed protein product [Heterosigma akashiwo]